MLPPIIILYRLHVLLLLCCFFIGCSQSVVSSNSFEAQVAFDGWLTSHPRLTDATSLQYLNKLSTRLVNQYAATKRELFLVQSSEPLAFSSFAGQIVISTKLLCTVKNEVEFAFIVAHEIAHQELGHSLNQHSSDQELEADRFGIALLALSGYDIRYAPLALDSIQDQSNDLTKYPSVITRKAALEKFIIGSNWQPPGIIDHRDFQILQRHLVRG